MSSAGENRIERRSGQRFPYQRAVLLRVPGRDETGAGFTQDLSARGATICTDFDLSEGQVIEMTLVMPSEITLAEDMSVCCRARVLRRQPSAGGNRSSVALRIEHYEFLPGEAPVAEAHAPRAAELSTRDS
jgi:hypothetical protein